MQFLKVCPSSIRCATILGLSSSSTGLGSTSLTYASRKVLEQWNHMAPPLRAYYAQAGSQLPKCRPCTKWLVVIGMPPILLITLSAQRFNYEPAARRKSERNSGTMAGALWDCITVGNRFFSIRLGSEGRSGRYRIPGLT